MRRSLALAIAGGLLAGAMTTAQAAAPKKVFEDASGDAGNQDAGLPGFDQMGFDLVEGSIAKKGKNLVFTATMAAMPEGGALPEGFRLLWHFNSGVTEYRLTIKSFDVGKPDALSQTGTERIGRVDADGHFRLESFGEGLTANTPAYVPEGYLEGAFDPASTSVSVTVPLKLIKAKTGTTITGGSGAAATSGCQICWVPHYAERSLTPYTIIDSAVMNAVYKVPKK
ncbi:MAG: hypothetical protein ABR575_02265 [Actinomycetota bacterium]